MASRRRWPSGRKTPRRNPRSTVATSTECYDFLRLLWARVGRTFCPQCGTRVRNGHAWTRWPRGCWPSPRDRAGTSLFPCGEHATTEALRDHLFDLRKKGFNRLFQGGRMFEFSTPESLLDIDFSKPSVVLVDRIAIAPGPAPAPGGQPRDLLSRSGRGDLRERARPAAERLRFNEKFQCKTCGMEFAEPEPILFSFNSPVGRVPALPGLRQHHRFRHGSGDSRTSRCRSTRAPWIRGPSRKYRSWLGNFRKSAQRAACASTCRSATSRDEEQEAVYDFIRRFFDHLETKKYKLHVRVFLSRYRGYALCPECSGARLRKEALYVRVGGKNLADVVRMNIAEARQFFDGAGAERRRRAPSPTRSWWRSGSG